MVFPKGIERKRERGGGERKNTNVFRNGVLSHPLINISNRNNIKYLTYKRKHFKNRERERERKNEIKKEN